MRFWKSLGENINGMVGLASVSWTGLDPENQDPESVQAVLKDSLVSELASYPVSKKVNSVRNNGPECVEPV